MQAQLPTVSSESFYFSVSPVQVIQCVYKLAIQLTISILN